MSNPPSRIGRGAAAAGVAAAQDHGDQQAPQPSPHRSLPNLTTDPRHLPFFAAAGKAPAAYRPAARPQASQRPASHLSRGVRRVRAKASAASLMASAWVG